eukprot:g3457.t1
MSLHHVRAIVPKLGAAARSTVHKGQHGKVGVVGGCFEYTGAPFYAAISALKQGADISFVFCSPEAAIPIKSYSPEIIVHPVMPKCRNSDTSSLSSAEAVDKAVASVVKSFPRLSSLVIGPGLGRDELTLDATAGIIEAARSYGLPLLVDADGLYLLSQRPSLIRGYSKAILTPNVVELKRLWIALFGEKTLFPGDGPSLESKGAVASVHGKMVHPEKDSSSKHLSAAFQIARELGNLTVLQKGPEDIISNGLVEVVCSAVGSPRRCGGQGDVLAGCAATFQAWSMMEKKHFESERSNSSKPFSTVVKKETSSENENKKNAADNDEARMVVAAWGGALVVRRSAYLAYCKSKRSMTTPNIINSIGEAFQQIFPSMTVIRSLSASSSASEDELCAAVGAAKTAILEREESLGSIVYEHERSMDAMILKVERLKRKLDASQLAEKELQATVERLQQDRDELLYRQ